MDNDVLYKKSYFGRLEEIGKSAPAAFNAFHKFDKKALAPGFLSGKLKELIAVAVAHTTGCPYCIDLHVNNIKKQGTSKGEMVDGIMVATAIKARSSIAHGANALNSYDSNEQEELYRTSNFNRLKELSSLNGNAFKAFINFEQKSMKASFLDAKEKELIAIAVAHTTGCPYCIDLHTKNAKKTGAAREEIAEAIMVSTALKAGSAIAHSVNALNAFDK